MKSLYFKYERIILVFIIVALTMIIYFTTKPPIPPKQQHGLYDGTLWNCPRGKAFVISITKDSVEYYLQSEDEGDSFEKESIEEFYRKFKQIE